MTFFSVFQNQTEFVKIRWYNYNSLNSHIYLCVKTILKVPFMMSNVHHCYRTVAVILFFILVTIKLQILPVCKLAEVQKYRIIFEQSLSLQKLIWKLPGMCQILKSFPKSILYCYTFVLVKMAEQRAELRTMNIYHI